VTKKSPKKKPGKRSPKSEPLFAPKCRNCSGFEEKLSVVEHNEIKEEVSLMHKHEIIRQMSAFIGDNAQSLVQAEEIFDRFRYMMAEYVLKHEFNCESRLSVQMVLWLEQKCEPKAAAPLNNIISQYLTKRT
jgi:hypothetical protein